jgi:RNA polymerase sigma-32 factor
MFFKLRREKVRVTNLVGDPEEAERVLAERLNLPEDQVRSMLRRLEARDVSLDAKVFDDAATSLIDTLVSPDRSQEQTLAADGRQHYLKGAVKSAIDNLDSRERYIVEKRLMADPEDELSLAELGRQLGVSRERARQLEARAKRKLKVRLEAISREDGADWIEPEPTRSGAPGRAYVEELPSAPVV